MMMKKKRSVCKFYVQEHLEKDINAPVRRIYPYSCQTFRKMTCVRKMKFYKLNYSSDLPLKHFDDDKSSLVTVRRASVINEDIEPVHRSHYEHDFRPINQENRARASIEHNVKGLIDGCLRSSLHDISENTRGKKDGKCIDLTFEEIHL